MVVTVDLGGPLEAFVDKAIAEGRYASRAEFLQDGVRLLEARERRTLERLIRPALNEMDGGNGRDRDEVFDEVLAELDAKIAVQESGAA